MSLQHALRYVALSRRPEAVGGEAPRLECVASLEDACAAGAMLGLSFSEAELREAHALDWAMRYQRLGATFSAQD